MRLPAYLPACLPACLRAQMHLGFQHAEPVVMGYGYVIEARKEAELPEVMLCCCELHFLQPSRAARFPPATILLAARLQFNIALGVHLHLKGFLKNESPQWVLGDCGPQRPSLETRPSQ